jgi:serine phosphatase RsbU (regulator of sigma subunit)
MTAGQGALLYTDGLTEARHDGQFLGHEAVSAALAALHQPSPSEAIAVLRARAADFAYGALTDDVCLLGVRIN